MFVVHQSSFSRLTTLEVERKFFHILNFTELLLFTFTKIDSIQVVNCNHVLHYNLIIIIYLLIEPRHDQSDM